jgi:putative membrane protein
MKNLISLFYGLPLLLLLYSCNNRSADSEKRAKEENDAKIDSQSTSLNQEPAGSTTMLSKSDADFLVEAASGGMMEVELGQLVQSKSSSEQVKAFGNMMIKDHETGTEKLKQLATSKNVTLPDAISTSQQKEKEKLQKERDDFDRAYISLMVDDHKKDIRDFQKAAKSADDSEIKAFAADNLPMLYMHLDSAQKLLKRMGPKRIPVSAPPYQ